MLLYTFESILYSTQASTDMISVFFHFPFISKVLSHHLLQLGHLSVDG